MELVLSTAENRSSSKPFCFVARRSLVGAERWLIHRSLPKRGNPPQSSCVITLGVKGVHHTTWVSNLSSLTFNTSEKFRFGKRGSYSAVGGMNWRACHCRCLQIASCRCCLGHCWFWIFLVMLECPPNYRASHSIPQFVAVWKQDSITECHCLPTLSMKRHSSPQ